MNTPTESNRNSQATGTGKPGLFKRIFTKMDNAMKTKAEEQAKSNCCSGDSKGKGGKCC